MIRKFLCLIGWHKHFVIKPLSEIVDQIGCVHCQRKWAINYSCRGVLRWDRELEMFYEELGRLKDAGR